MDDDLHSMREKLLAQAQMLLVAFPEVEALQEVTISPLPADTVEDDMFWSALRYLREGMVLVREGLAGSRMVLEDEINYTESLLVGWGWQRK